jgi:secondary thiamine-phosphate synthase enzyme
LPGGTPGSLAGEDAYATIKLARGAGCGYKNGMVYQREIQLQTSGHRQMHDLTDEVARVVSESRVRCGVVHIFNVGSTATVGTIEFEPGLQQDLPAMLDKLLPPSRDYGHEQAWHDGNGHSHLQATMMGPSLTVPIRDGKLVLGTWQQVFHLECDVKPRRRTILITAVGES